MMSRLGRHLARGQSTFGSLTVLLAIEAVIFMARGSLGDYWVEIGFHLLIAAVLAESWNLLAGYTGLVSLGSAAFFGLGSYIAYGVLNRTGLGIGASVGIAAIGGALLAVLVSGAIFRLRGLYFTVGTLAIGESLRLLMINVPWFNGATGLVLDQDPPDSHALFTYALLLYVIVTLIMAVGTGSRFAILLKAVRDDEDAAGQMGVVPFSVKLIVFAVASALIASAGALQGIRLGAIEPYGSFGMSWSVEALTMVIIGGTGKRFGAIVGAVFAVTLSELLADYPEFHVAATGVIMILLIRFAPGGICGVVLGLMERLSSSRRTHSAEGGLSRG